MQSHVATTAERAGQLRSAMRVWTTGVAIVTAAHAGETHGMTVSSFTSISLDPPLIAISLNADSQTHSLVQRARAFGVTILAADQQELSERFAGEREAAGDRMAGVATETYVTGAPFIRGGLAFLDCRVTKTIGAGGNTLFVAEVVAVREDGGGLPLVYHNRGYRQLKD